MSGLEDRKSQMQYEKSSVCYGGSATVFFISYRYALYIFGPVYMYVFYYLQPAVFNIRVVTYTFSVKCTISYGCTLLVTDIH